MYTDCPIIALGDGVYNDAPLRACSVLACNNGVCLTNVDGIICTNLKIGYIYTTVEGNGEKKKFAYKELAREQIIANTNTAFGSLL